MEKIFKKGTSGNNQIDYMLDQLYTAINSIVDQLNSTSAQQKPSDPPSSLRVVKQSNDTYIIAIKSADGWLVSDSASTTGFRFQTHLD